MNTKYNFYNQRLLCNDKNSNFIANFQEIVEMLKKTYEAADTPKPPSGDFSAMLGWL